MERLICVVVAVSAACGLMNPAPAAEETLLARGPYVSMVTTHSAILFFGATAR